MDEQEKKMNMTVKPHVGDAITYRLRPSENPRNPLRLWHGRVEAVYTSTCKVWVTETGYESFDEIILFEQIVDIKGEPKNEVSHAQ
jgi:hypothetical protein